MEGRCEDKDYARRWPRVNLTRGRQLRPIIYCTRNFFAYVQRVAKWDKDNSFTVDKLGNTLLTQALLFNH